MHTFQQIYKHKFFVKTGKFSANNNCVIGETQNHKERLQHKWGQAQANLKGSNRHCKQRHLIWRWSQSLENHSPVTTPLKCTLIIFPWNHHLYIIAGLVIWRDSHANTHDLCGHLSQWCMHIDIQVYVLVENRNDLEVFVAFEDIPTKLCQMILANNLLLSIIPPNNLFFFYY